MKKARDIIRKFDLKEDELDKQLREAMGDVADPLENVYEDSVKHFEPDSILSGRILDVINDDPVQ